MQNPALHRSWLLAREVFAIRMGTSHFRDLEFNDSTNGNFGNLEGLTSGHEASLGQIRYVGSRSQGSFGELQLTEGSGLAKNSTGGLRLVLGRECNIFHHVNALTESIPGTTDGVMELGPFGWKIAVQRNNVICLGEVLGSGTEGKS